MERYYKERFETRSCLDEKIVPLVKINQILQEMRDELREAIPSAMDTRILLLDPDARKYTRPLQCILYDRPVARIRQRNRDLERHRKAGSHLFPY